MVRVWGGGGVEPADVDMLCGQDKDSEGMSWLSGWQWMGPGHPGSDVAPGARAKQEISEPGHPQGEGKERWEVEKLEVDQEFKGDLGQVQKLMHLPSLRLSFCC